MLTKKNIRAVLGLCSVFLLLSILCYTASADRSALQAARDFSGLSSQCGHMANDVSGEGACLYDGEDLSSREGSNFQRRVKYKIKIYSRRVLLTSQEIARSVLPADVTVAETGDFTTERPGYYLFLFRFTLF